MQRAVSCRAGDLGWSVRQEQCILRGSKRETEQLENPAADPLLRVALLGRAQHHPLVRVLRADTLQGMTHQEMDQHFRDAKRHRHRAERMP